MHTDMETHIQASLHSYNKTFRNQRKRKDLKSKDRKTPIIMRQCPLVNLIREVLIELFRDQKKAKGEQ